MNHVDRISKQAKRAKIKLLVVCWLVGSRSNTHNCSAQRRDVRISASSQ